MNLDTASTRGPRHALCPQSGHKRAFAAAFCAAALTISFVGCTKGDIRPSQQVLLEAAASAGESPWMESVSSANVPTEVTRVQSSSAAAAETQDDTVTVSGDQVGLYGGTPGVAACDREKMVNFLDTHPQQATAWKNVTGAKDIRTYAQTLSPVVLTQDTRVTNHGFKNGQAAPFQSVLETGTPVLIDDRGVPRVRCACGNPLVEPQSDIKPQFSGTAWKTFKKTSLVTVQQSVNTLDKVELVSVPAKDAPAPVTPFAAITPGEITPEPAPETKLPEGATLVPAEVPSEPDVPDVNTGPGSDTSATPTTTTSTSTEESPDPNIVDEPDGGEGTTTSPGEEPAEPNEGEQSSEPSQTQTDVIIGELPAVSVPQLPISLPPLPAIDIPQLPQLPPLIEEPS